MKFKRFLDLFEAEVKPKEEEEKDDETEKAPEEGEKPAEKKPDEAEKKPEDEEDVEKKEEKPDPDKEFEKPDEEDTSEADQLQAEIDAKFEEIGDKVMTEIKHLLDTKASVFLGKVKATGIDETVRDFLENYFLKSLTDNKDKVFISLNMDELIPFIAQKISVEYLKK